MTTSIHPQTQEDIVTMIENHDGDFTIVIFNGIRVISFDHYRGEEYAFVALELAQSLQMSACIKSESRIRFELREQSIEILLK